MNNRSNISNVLNLTLAGRVATFENKSQSQAAGSAAALVSRMMRTWSQVFDYGTKLRADLSRPVIEREQLLAQFGKKQIDAISPSVTQAMNALNSRRASAQERIEALHHERDTLAAMKGSEARSFLRSLPDGERIAALADPMLARAASCAPARMSGLTPEHHAMVRDGVAAREVPETIQELADLDAGTELLLMASQALLSNTMQFTDQENVSARVEAPDAA